MANQGAVKRRRQQEDLSNTNKEVSIQVRNDSEDTWKGKGNGILDVTHAEDVMMLYIKSDGDNLLEELLYDDIYTLKDSHLSVSWKVADRDLFIQVVFIEEHYYYMFKGYLSYHFHRNVDPMVPSIFKANASLQDYRQTIINKQHSPLEKVIVAHNLLEHNHLPKIVSLISNNNPHVTDIIRGVVALGYPPLLEIIFKDHRHALMNFLLVDPETFTIYTDTLSQWQSLAQHFDCLDNITSLITIRFIRNHVITNKTLKDFESSVTYSALKKIFTAVSIDTLELQKLTSNQVHHLLGMVHYVTPVEKQVDLLDLLTHRSRVNKQISVFEVLVHEEEKYGEQVLHQLISRFGDRRCEEPLVPVRRMLLHPRSELLWSALVKRLSKTTDGLAIHHILGLHDREGDVEERNRCVEVIEGRAELATHLTSNTNLLITPLVDMVLKYFTSETDCDECVVAVLSLFTKMSTSPHLRETVFPSLSGELLSRGVFDEERLQGTWVSKFAKIGILQVAKAMIVNSKNSDSPPVGTYFAVKGFADWTARIIGDSANQNTAISSAALSLVASSCKTLRGFYCSMYSDIIDSIPSLASLKDTWKADLRKQWASDLEQANDCDTLTNFTPVKRVSAVSPASKSPCSVDSSPSTLSSCSTECVDNSFTDLGEEVLWNPRSALSNHEGPPAKIGALSSFLSELPRRPTYPVLRNSAPPPASSHALLDADKQRRRPLSELRNV